MKVSNGRKIYEKLIDLTPYERLAIIDKKKQEETHCKDCVCVACCVEVDEHHMYKVMDGNRIQWTKRIQRVIDIIANCLDDDDSFEIHVFDLRK